MTILYPFLGILLILGLIMFLSWRKNSRRGRPFVGLLQLLTSASFFALLIAAGFLIFSTFGYQRLTYEQPIAHIYISKHKDQLFSAEIVFENGTRKNFTIAGDEIYIDARILKWKAWANLVGLHTLYRLERIGGRYLNYDEEVGNQRTLFQFDETARDDLFDYSADYPFLNTWSMPNMGMLHLFLLKMNLSTYSHFPAVG